MYLQASQIQFSRSSPITMKESIWLVYLYYIILNKITINYNCFLYDIKAAKKHVIILFLSERETNFALRLLDIV